MSFCAVFATLCSLTGPATVHDGDTITLQHYHIRLAGVDAEELNEPHGDEARLAMLAMIAGRDVTCKLTGEKSYNRVVGTCWAYDGRDLNAEIIRRGFALDCARYSGGKYRKLEPDGARDRLLQKPYC